MASGLRSRLERIAATQPPAATQRTASPPPEPAAAAQCMTLTADFPLDAAAMAAAEQDIIDIAGEDGAGFDMRRALFFDTETTGLAGGAGTVAFLVGLGWVEGDRFVVQQFFLRDYSEEEAMLDQLAAIIPCFTHLVTFNGKSFDVPLMEDRYTLMRRRADWRRLKHVDLIHPARRIWKLRLERCSLSSLEESVLGVKRDLDIPGSEVPERYFHYLKTGDFDEMREVIEHNRQDIVTLMLLIGRMAELFRTPLEAGYSEDIYSIGRALQRAGDSKRALECYEATAHGGTASRATQSMSMLLKRDRELDAAMRVWLDMEVRGLGGLMPYVELSKAYEHKLKDYGEALKHTEAAITLCQALGDREALAELTHRRDRLIKKRDKGD